MLIWKIYFDESLQMHIFHFFLHFLGLYTFNSFMPNGFPHLYQLDKSFSNIRVVGGGDTFHLYSNFDRTFCKQTVKTLIRRPKFRNGLVQLIKMA